MTAQIIFITLVILSLMFHSYKHGKDRGKYNIIYYTLDMCFTIFLLYWGGFFDPILK